MLWKQKPLVLETIPETSRLPQHPGKSGWEGNRPRHCELRLCKRCDAKKNPQSSQQGYIWSAHSSSALRAGRRCPSCHTRKDQFLYKNDHEVHRLVWAKHVMEYLCGASHTACNVMDCAARSLPMNPTTRFLIGKPWIYCNALPKRSWFPYPQAMSYCSALDRALLSLLTESFSLLCMIVCSSHNNVANN